MSFNKYASGGSVDIRVTARPDGTKEYKVIRHNDGATCENSDDQAIIDKLIKMGVPGFGDGGQVVDEGPTSEFFEEKKKNKPQKNKQVSNQPMFDEEEDEGTTTKNRDSHDAGGMGV